MLSEVTLEKIIRSGPSFHEFKKKSDVMRFPGDFTNMINSYGEVYFWEKGNFHVVTRAMHAREVLTSPDFSADRGAFFISRMPNMDLGLIQDFFGVVKKMMVMSDDSEHVRRRKVAAAGFEDHILEKFKLTMHKTVKLLIKNLQGKTEFDFVETVSKKLPATVLAELFSIPETDRDKFLEWSNIMTGFFGGASEYRNEDGIEVNNAALALKNYFTNLVQERKSNPGNDYVSILSSMQEKMGFGHDELISQLIMMLVAGMATTTDQINNIMYLFASREDVQNEVRNDPELIPAFIEECKRFDPAVTFIFRVAKNHTSIGNQPIAPGEVVFISTHAINRDFPLEDRPQEIKIHRRLSNFSYGHGAHYCIGAKLARMEMISLFEELIHELPPIKLNPLRPSVRDHYSLSFSGFKELHLVLR